MTGPEALRAALASIDLDKEAEEMLSRIKSGKATQRRPAVKALNAIRGLQKNQVSPDQLMITKVPVIPPQFRPFSIAGETFIPGDSNEVYQDVFKARDNYRMIKERLGGEDEQDAYLTLYDTIKGAYGYGEHPNQKLTTRGVKGFLKQVTGTSPKTGFAQRKLFSKTQDNIGRAVIIPDADLSMDEIGIPEKIAWRIYNPYIQRRLVRTGMPLGEALKNLKDRTGQARRALELEMEERPVVYSRAPAWYKFNVVAGKPRIVDGDAIRVNTFITDGMNADFDGDQMNVRVQSSPEAIKEAKEILMPSKMLFSTRDRDKVVPVPKHEQVLGLYEAGQRKPGATHTFATPEEAEEAINSGKISITDTVEFGENK